MVTFIHRGIHRARMPIKSRTPPPRGMGALVVPTVTKDNNGVN